RIAAIEADRSVPVADLWGRIEPQLARLGTTLEAFADEDWGFEVTHPTLGVMVMPAILDRFLVGHLEEHAQQLEGLVGEGPGLRPAEASHRVVPPRRFARLGRAEVA